MAQCLWTKVRTKQWLVLSASAFQCIRTGFLCPIYDSFACLNTRQDQNELHLKRWVFFFFLPKSGSSVSRSQAILVRRKDKTNYLSNQTRAKCYILRNKHWLKKTSVGGPYIPFMYHHISASPYHTKAKLCKCYKNKKHFIFLMLGLPLFLYPIKQRRFNFQDWKKFSINFVIINRIKFFVYFKAKISLIDAGIGFSKNKIL